MCARIHIGIILLPYVVFIFFFISPVFLQNGIANSPFTANSQCLPRDGEHSHVSPPWHDLLFFARQWGASQGRCNVSGCLRWQTLYTCMSQIAAYSCSSICRACDGPYALHSHSQCVQFPFYSFQSPISFSLTLRYNSCSSLSWLIVLLWYFISFC